MKPSEVASRLRKHKELVLKTWEERVRQSMSQASGASSLVLRDTLPKLLDSLIEDLASDRPRLEAPQQLATEHGRQRAALHTFHIEQVVAEYHVLHRVLLDVLDSEGELPPASRDLITDAIHIAIGGATATFARMRAMDRDEQFRTLVEGVKDYAIFTIDPEGYVTSWNRGAERMKQYTVEEIIGRHFSILYPAEGIRRDEPMEHLRTAATEGRFRGEGVRVRKNGDPFLADVLITPMYDDSKLVGFSKVVQDLTERSTLIQERDLSREHAAELLSQRDLRERFVTMLTHDLRSPLSAIKAGAALIERTPEKAERVRTLASRISASVVKLDRMIGDLLDANRLDAGEHLPIHPEPCDVDASARELCTDLASRYGDRFRIESPGPLKGYWDCKGLYRVLDNLVTNALKYGEAYSPITIRLMHVADRLLIEVHNRGTLIPREEQEALFRPFHRTATAHATEKHGWGLGLTLVRGIAEAHGGVVKVESYVIEGTTFTVDLPFDARGVASPAPV